MAIHIHFIKTFRFILSTPKRPGVSFFSSARPAALPRSPSWRHMSLYIDYICFYHKASLRFSRGGIH
ncbi:MAG: hypothetical protein V1797_15830, partial [Pseudomonadota bacterium]